MRIIAHLDMDAFFAAVEERDRPYLTGQPIAVGSDPAGGKGRGVVSTANYAARAYGIRSATPIRTAWALSEAARKKGLPPVIFISSQFRRYGDVSKKVMNIVERHVEGNRVSLFDKTSPLIEQVSVDECFFDLSFAGSFAQAERLARKIQAAIKKEEKLTCSVGIGPNKLLAKIASDFKKPAGLTAVPPDRVDSFLKPLSVRKIPGVGPKAEAVLRKHRIETVVEAQKLSREKLRELFGKWGILLYRKLRGEDDSPVEREPEPAKSIGEQETLMEDSLDMKVLMPVLEKQSEHLIRYLKKEGFSSFHTMVLTVRFADFVTVSRSRTLSEETASGEVLRRNATQMFFPFFDRRENPRRQKIRLVGLRIEKLK